MSQRTSPLRLLLLTPGYPPLPGGGERYVRELAQELARRGVRVTAVSTHARAEPDFWRGAPAPLAHETDADTRGGAVTLVRCPVRPFPGGRPGLLAWRKLMVLVSRLPGSQTAVLQRMARRVPPIANLSHTLAALPGPFDLVHGFNLSWEAAALAGAAYAAARRLPFAVTPFAHFGADPRDRVAWNNLMDHQRQLLAAADAVLTLTHVELENLNRWGVFPRRAAVLGGGLDPLPPPLDPAPLLARWGIKRPFALFVGRATFDKGAVHALAAARLLARQGIDLPLVLVGRAAPDFARALARLSPADQARVHPLGFLPDAEKHALLAACQMLLLPSHSDSFGIVFLEAWAHHRPVVGARAGGIPGVVDDEENGLLVPFGDVPALAAAMRRLVADPLLANRLGEAGHQKVQHTYTWPRVADRLLETYTSLL